MEQISFWKPGEYTYENGNKNSEFLTTEGNYKNNLLNDNYGEFTETFEYITEYRDGIKISSKVYMDGIRVD